MRDKKAEEEMSSLNIPRFSEKDTKTIFKNQKDPNKCKSETIEDLFPASSSLAYDPGTRGATKPSRCLDYRRNNTGRSRFQYATRPND
jgi:hypothetical protein